MNDLRDLYQEMILDHNRSPRNRGPIENPDLRANGHNPLCGDVITVFANVEDGVVKSLTFDGEGCAISIASASLMTEVIVGKTVREAERVFEIFRHALTDEGAELPEGEEFDRLRALEGVKDYPVRVKCATLAWHTLDAALHRRSEATTE